MPKERTYRISLNPAERHAGGYRTSYSLRGDDRPHMDTTARTLDELDQEIRDLVQLAGEPPAIVNSDENALKCWAVNVSLIDGGRRPNGFDAWRDAHRFYEYEPAR